MDQTKGTAPSDNPFDWTKLINSRLLGVFAPLVVGLALLVFGNAEANQGAPPELEAVSSLDAGNVVRAANRANEAIVLAEHNRGVAERNKQRLDLYDAARQSPPAPQLVAPSVALAIKYIGVGLLICAGLLTIRWVAMAIYESVE